MTTARRARARTAVDPARRAAFDAMLAVETADAYLNLALPRLLAEAAVAGRDAAFATELAHGASRLQGRYDAIVGRCVESGVAAMQPEVRVALRLGSHQLLAMRVPAHAAVGTTVELVRASAGERPVRLVNAVLRRIGARSLDDWLTELTSLADRSAHPAWIIDALADALRYEDAESELPALLEADNQAPRVTLAVRPGLATVDRLLGSGATPARYSPYAATLTTGRPIELSQVRDGTVGVQDEGSQLAALALARAEIEGGDRRWLDLCAGPGGKSALLTGLARERGAVLVAAERLPHRATLVARSLRAYQPPAPIVVADGTRPAWRAASFDRVLVDAPCTGLGALRRRPEARWRRTPHDLAALVPLQRALLESALEAVRPGGVVGYVTCSPHLDETVSAVSAVLDQRPDVHQEDVRALLAEVDRVGTAPHVQLWPHRHGTDAMFIAILRRQ